MACELQWLTVNVLRAKCCSICWPGWMTFWQHHGNHKNVKVDFFKVRTESVRYGVCSFTKNNISYYSFRVYIRHGGKNSAVSAILPSATVFDHISKWRSYTVKWSKYWSHTQESPVKLYSVFPGHDGRCTHLHWHTPWLGKGSYQSQSPRTAAL